MSVAGPRTKDSRREDDGDGATGAAGDGGWAVVRGDGEVAAAETEEIGATKLELLVQVKVCDGLRKPTASEPKSWVVGLRVGWPPSPVSSKSMYSSSFSCGVIAPATHSVGKDWLGELLFLRRGTR